MGADITYTTNTVVLLKLLSMKKRIINLTVPSEWAGIPEAMHHSGMTKNSLYKLLRESGGQIENALVLGRRLINLKSLSAYLSKLSKQQATATEVV
jgi:hypothetical protein